MGERVLELFYVCGIALVVFHFSQPLFAKFASIADLRRRRNIWFLVTIAAFLIPNFWLFVAVAGVLIVWAARRDSNSTALYLLLLHVAPATAVNIPIIGNNGLFPFSMYELLAFCILCPAMWRLRAMTAQGTHPRGHWLLMDVLFLAFGILQIVLYLPPDLPTHVIIPDSYTNVLRRAFLFAIDAGVLYYVISRSCTTPRLIAEALAMLCLSGGILAAVACFESARHWLLYADIWANWLGSPAFYTLRGSALRASAAIGGPLELGFFLAIVCGFWMYLQMQIQQRLLRWSFTIILWLGLFSTYSRGPWIGAVISCGCFIFIRPQEKSKLIKSAALMVVGVALIMISPIGDRIAANLPFMSESGHADTFDYRVRFTQRALELIPNNPFFGDQLANAKMEDLRQGQGIIDPVNVYAAVALFYGLVGLAALIGAIVVGTLKIYFRSRDTTRDNLEFSALGADLVACSLALLVMFSSVSFFATYENTYYVLLGLMGAYLQISLRRRYVSGK